MCQNGNLLTIRRFCQKWQILDKKPIAIPLPLPRIEFLFMKKTVLFILVLQMAFMMACKDKNAKPPSDQDILGQVSRPGARDPQSTAGRLNQATSASADQSALVWAGDIDPICSMKVERSVEDTAHYQGKIFGFCSESCKEKFQESPQKWAEKH